MSRQTDLPSPEGLGKSARRRLQRQLQEVLGLEAELRGLEDEELRLESQRIRSALASDPSRSELDRLQARSFALTREAADRVLGQRAFPVQVLGGLAIAEGMIAEMATGEGKTLTSTMPIVWLAQHGRGVHVATANPYLAARDAAWMGPVYAALGVSVAVSAPGMDVPARRAAYEADVTYSTAAQLGFDHLGDNMVDDAADKVQRSHFAAVVDEADSLLIDEARTPLVVSAPDPSPTADWKRFVDLAKELLPEHYEYDPAEESVHLTVPGTRLVEERLGVENLFDNPPLVHQVQTALKAVVVFVRDKDYVVTEGRDGQTSVVIVDAHTGRTMLSRRYQNSIHEALEAKEGLPVKRPSITTASITLQSYFAMYERLGGMTGTAHTDAPELEQTYGTPVARIPTHRPLQRIDRADLLYATVQAKHEAVAREVKERHEKGQPVLVGTLSVEESEALSLHLDKHGVKHSVLNARRHEEEALTISQAGRRGAVTVATNMAGRGVDIKLGGDPSGLARPEEGASSGPDPSEEWAREREEVLALGGLFVLGTGRNPSRRIDDQLRGRSGRQGEPGETVFFLSCEDDVVAAFGGDKVSLLVSHAASAPDEPVQHKLLSKIVERSQRKLETHHAEQRKSLLDFDRVLTRQRDAVYAWRDRILEAEFDALGERWLRRTFTGVLEELGVGTPAADSAEVTARMQPLWPAPLPDPLAVAPETVSVEEAVESILEPALVELRRRFAGVPAEIRSSVLRHILLQFVDSAWAEQLTELELAVEGMYLRSIGQQDTKVAFSNEAYDMFLEMVESAHRRGTRFLWTVEASVEDSAAPVEPATEGVSEPDDSPATGGEDLS